MKNTAKVEIGKVGDSFIITVPKALIESGKLDLEKPYEVIIAPRNTFVELVKAISEKVLNKTNVAKEEKDVFNDENDICCHSRKNTSGP